MAHDTKRSIKLHKVPNENKLIEYKHDGQTTIAYIYEYDSHGQIINEYIKKMK